MLKDITHNKKGSYSELHSYTFLYFCYLFHTNVLNFLLRHAVSGHCKKGKFRNMWCPRSQVKQNILKKKIWLNLLKNMGYTFDHLSWQSGGKYWGSSEFKYFHYLIEKFFLEKLTLNLHHTIAHMYFIQFKTLLEWLTFERS